MDKSEPLKAIAPAPQAPVNAVLSEDQLDAVTGGLIFQFKLVAVKTVSWSETPYESMKGGTCTK